MSNDKAALRLERKVKALELYASGLSSYEVAEIVHVEPCLVWRWAKNAGINRKQSEVSHKRRLPSASTLMKALQHAVHHIDKCVCGAEAQAACTYKKDECSKIMVKHFIDEVSNA